MWPKVVHSRTDYMELDQEFRMVSIALSVASQIRNLTSRSC